MMPDEFTHNFGLDCSVAAAGVRLPALRRDRQGLVRTERRFGEVVLLPSAEGFGSDTT